jgi:hypothetical protein
MKAIIFNTENEAIELNNNLTECCLKLFDKKTTSYSYILKHPSKELFCVPIDDKGIYSDVVKKITKAYDVDELTKDWLPKEDEF